MRKCVTTGARGTSKCHTRLWSLMSRICTEYCCYAKNRGYRAPNVCCRHIISYFTIPSTRSRPYARAQPAKELDDRCCPLVWDCTSHAVGGAIHIHIPLHRRIPVMHKKIRGDRIQDASKSRRSGYVSRIAHMHAMVSLCKKPGLSCPKTGVIMPQNRGYRAPNFFWPCPISHFYSSFEGLNAFMHA